MFLSFALLTVLTHLHTAAGASTFAGSTSTFEFPPANADATAVNTFFPSANEVGFPGPTPTGDEANAIATAPAVAKVENVFPLVQPDTSDHQGESFDIMQHWGNLSPFNSVKTFGLSNASARIPKGCELTQVHLLHRHGARYPTNGSAPSAFASRLHAAASSGTGFNASGPLDFLNTWTYKLGADILTPFGRNELFNLGVGFRVKYGDLLKGFTDLPVFRTTSEARMVDSALHFAAGFFGVQSYANEYHQLIQIEQTGFNSTLVPDKICPNANNDIASFGIESMSNWTAIYLADAQSRLSSFVEGYNLTISDLVAMQQLCAYETVALGWSSFCDLFTKEEWKGFEYALDLEFWYSFGPGNPASSAQGLGWVQELVARLEERPITVPDSTINGTLDGNNVTFPLNQPIYVDATHDTTLSEIFTALNFTSFASGGPLPTDHIPKHRTYLINQIVPFSANLVGQVLSCPASFSSQNSGPTHIRWILNDAVVPLTGISGCVEDENGLCELDIFTSGMKQRIEEIDFNFDCFANYSIPIPDNVVDGRFPKNL
ncbi:hypothetical protein VKT23_003278 [Stygiomarasmius scandens]|uniref:Phosphoglycerate mutase-like protein n=1 Tax=Marasmiellus scandens TaxID=2682957 RepID=A0ABR1JWR0_9AGAR